MIIRQIECYPRTAGDYGETIAIIVLILLCLWLIWKVLVSDCRKDELEHENERLRGKG